MKILPIFRIALLGMGVVLFCLATGCSSYYYVPNTHNIPLLQENGEVKLAGHASAGDDVEALEVQGAMAVSNSVAIMANAQYVNEDEGELTGRGHIFEAGVGYFYPLAENMVFEVYSGYGGGRVRNNYDEASSSVMRIKKTFLQPQVGIRTNNFELAFANRIGTLHFSDIQTLNVIQNEDLDAIRRNRNSIYNETSITSRFGHKNLKFQAQWVIARNLTFPELPMENSIISFGLSLGF